MPSCGGFDQSSIGFTPQQKRDRLMLIPEIGYFHATIEADVPVTGARMWALEPSRYRRLKRAPPDEATKQANA